MNPDHTQFLQKIRNAALLPTVLLSFAAFADTTVVDHPNTGSPPTGPYGVVIEHESGLATHTIYRPANFGAVKHPILVWGEGACADAGLQFPEYLSEIASYGIVVIADGPPVLYNRAEATSRLAESRASGQAITIKPDGTDLIAALDWVFTENRNSSSKYFEKLNTGKVAAMGMSCGGLMSYGASSDPRITALGIWNSGLLTEDPAILHALHQPVILITGNEGDIAYANGKRDFEQIPDHVSIFYGVHPAVEHSGTYTEDNGGAFGKVAVAWLKWQLFDDTSAMGKGMFVGDNCGLCNDAGWIVASKNMH